MLMTFYSSHQVLQLLSICKMLSICNDYACEYPMSFNAQKSKCLVVLPRSRRSLAPLLCHCDFRIGGMSVEMVTSYCHLGHVVTSNLDDSLVQI